MKRQSSFTVPSSEVSRNVDNSTFDVVKVVSDNIGNVNYVGNNMDDITKVGEIHTEISSLESIHNIIVSLYNDKVVLDSLYTDKATLDSLFSDKEVLDSLYTDKNKLDSIFADKNKLDSIYTDLSQLESLYADKATLDSLFNDKVTLDRLHKSVAAIDRIYTSIINVDTVANNIDAVNTSADDIANIITVAASINDVSTTATSIQDISTAADNISSIGFIADNMDEVTYFADIYQGPKDTQPSVRNDSSALQNGDLYFQIETDTLKAQMMEYDATNNMWVAVGSTVNGTSRRQVFIATEGQTTFTITGGYDANYADVYINGRKLVNGDDVVITSGTDIVLTNGANDNDVIDVVAYGIFLLADHYSKDEANELLTTKADLNGNTSETFKAANAINDEDVTTKAQTFLNIKVDRLITVGDGGDFATINEALTEASKAYPLYVQSGYSVEIRLLAGFVMTEQVIVNGIDLGYITITGEDDETVISQIDLTIPYIYFDTNYYPAISVINGVSPIVGQLFSMDDSGDSDTYNYDGVCVDNSTMTILPDCGVINCSYNGAKIIHNGKLIASYSNFSGCSNGIRSNDSSALVKYANLSNCNNGCYVSNSTINVANANVSNCGNRGIYADMASIVYGDYADCSYSGNMGAEIRDGSFASLMSINFSNSTGAGIHIAHGARVNLPSAVGTDCGGNAIQAYYNSFINAYYTNVSSSDSDKYDYYCVYGSIIERNSPQGDSDGNLDTNSFGQHGAITA